MTPLTAQTIAAEFIRTGELFRVDVAEMNSIARHSAYCTAKDGEQILICPLSFCAVSVKVFADLSRVGVADVKRWLAAGMPQMADGYIPFRAATLWARRFLAMVEELP